MDFKVAPETFVDDIIRIIDGLTAEFIKTGFNTIANHWLSSGLLDSILTLYVLYFLYQAKFYNTPLADATRHLVKVVFVFILSTNWSVFYILIYNVATNGPLQIIKLLLQGQGNTLPDGSLNDTFITGIKQAMGLLANMPISFKGVVCSVFAAFFLILATFLFTLIALAIIIISKFYLAVYLALAPYFLVMFLFNGTQGLSESWVRACLSNALIPIFVGCVLLLTTVLAQSCMNTASFTGGKSPDFIGIILYFATALISAYLIKVTPEKAAALTSSLAIASAGQMANYGKKLSSSLSQAGSSLKKGGSAAKEAYSTRQNRLLEETRQRSEQRRQQLEEQRERRARAGY
ncbi:vir protein [Legionella nautarum]|uniref:Vir protein n=1 Tax=Legionella nautarum TaxID=45070 RepID=A0A0W0WJH7_9GAMM|nr:type IV secretion system protein [Legionella nautarum]KTD32198.1 vir protein [Legionella nautarum]